MPSAIETREYRQNKLLAFFNQRWDEISYAMDYDSNWESPESEPLTKVRHARGEIGYNFRGIHQDPLFAKVMPGVTVKSMDDHGRKMIMVETTLGVVMAYVSSIDPRGSIIVIKRPLVMVNAGFGDAITSYPRIPSDLAEIIGSPFGIAERDPRIFRNIGEWMLGTAKMLQDPSYRPRNVKRIKADGSEW